MKYGPVGRQFLESKKQGSTNHEKWSTTSLKSKPSTIHLLTGFFLIKVDIGYLHFVTPNNGYHRKGVNASGRRKRTGSVFQKALKSRKFGDELSLLRSSLLLNFMSLLSAASPKSSPQSLVQNDLCFQF